MFPKTFQGPWVALSLSFYLLNSDVSQHSVLGLLPFVLDSLHYSHGSSSLQDSDGAPKHIFSHCVSTKHWYDFQLLASHFHLGFLTDLTRFSQSEYQHHSHKPPLSVLPVLLITPHSPKESPSWKPQRHPQLLPLLHYFFSIIHKVRLTAPLPLPLEGPHLFCGQSHMHSQWLSYLPLALPCSNASMMKLPELPFITQIRLHHLLLFIIQWLFILFWIKDKYFLRSIRSTISALAPNITQLILNTL